MVLLFIGPRITSSTRCGGADAALLLGVGGSASVLNGIELLDLLRVLGFYNAALHFEGRRKVAFLHRKFTRENRRSAHLLKFCQVFGMIVHFFGDKVAHVVALYELFDRQRMIDPQFGSHKVPIR